MGRLAFRAGDNAGAIAWAERALAEAASQEHIGIDPVLLREATAMRAQAYPTYALMVEESVVRAVTILFLRDRSSPARAVLAASARAAVRWKADAHPSNAGRASVSGT